MKLNLFITLAFWLSSLGSSKYLTCKFYHDEYENFTYNPYMIEFWPDYAPLEPWVVHNDECKYDVKIYLIPFLNDRMVDYGAFRKGFLPALDTRAFSGKDLQPLFDKLIVKSTNAPLACSYDTVWYDPPSRFYTYHGFKMTIFDSHHGYIWSSYAPVPYLRQIDAVFVDPKTFNTVFIANDWYYAFDRYGGFQIQGRWAYLWSDFQYNPYVDSVLITRNKTLCRFYNDEIHCTEFDERTENPRYTHSPKPFGKLFGAANANDTTTLKMPKFPLKGSFWMPDRNQTILLDSNDYFWAYDSDYRWVYTKPFCEFDEFGKFPCCRLQLKENDTMDREDTTTNYFAERGNTTKHPFATNDTTTTPFEEDRSNSADEFSQFWMTVWRSLLLF